MFAKSFKFDSVLEYPFIIDRPLAKLCNNFLYEWILEIVCNHGACDTKICYFIFQKNWKIQKNRKKRKTQKIEKYGKRKKKYIYRIKDGG